MAEEKETKKTKVSLVNGNLINSETGNLLDTSKQTGEIIIESVQEDSLATGIAIPTYQKTSLDYLGSLREFSFDTDNVQKQIELSHKLYKIDGTVSTAVDVLIDFITSGFTIDCNKKLKPIFEHFSKNLNKDVKNCDTGLKAHIRELAFEWFLSGNAFPYLTWKDEKVGKRKGHYRLPSIVQLLNPLRIEIPEDSFIQNKPKYLFDSTVKMKGSQKKLSSLQEDQSGYHKKGISLYPNQKKELDASRIYHLKRRARNYDVWGIPYLVKTFNAVSTKMKLRALDTSTTEGLINMLTIFKVGSQDVNSPYHIVPSARLNALANVLKYPQASTTLIWSHDLEVETTGPEGEVLDFENKYSEVNSEIVRALGVPTVLLDGSGSASSAWVAILSLVERLERVREIIKEYIDDMFKKVVDKNKLGDSYPKFVWSPINLRNERTVKTILMAMWDRGLLPIETLHRESGYDPDEMIEKLNQEDRLELDDLIKRRDVPYSASPGRPESNPDPSSPDPTETDNPQYPKEEASAEEEKYIENLNIVYSEFKNKLSKKPGNKSAILVAMTKRIEQLIEAYTDIYLPKDNIFAQKIKIWNGKYLDKFVNNIGSEIGQEPDEYRTIGVFSSFENRFQLFCTESLKKIKLASSINQAKEEGKPGAYFKASENTNCDSCKSYNNNWYSLEEILDRFPIHPNQNLELEFTDNNPILDGEIINTPVQPHHKNFSQIL